MCCRGCTSGTRCAADAFKGCNLGAHEAFEGDVEGLVRDTEKLADAVVRLGAK